MKQPGDRQCPPVASRAAPRPGTPAGNPSPPWVTGDVATEKQNTEQQIYRGAAVQNTWELRYRDTKEQRYREAEVQRSRGTEEQGYRYAEYKYSRSAKIQR